MRVKIQMLEDLILYVSFIPGCRQMACSCDIPV